jgi:hypothetical protein
MSDDVSSCVLLLRIIILAADLTDDGRLMTCDVDELSSKGPNEWESITNHKVNSE